MDVRNPKWSFLRGHRIGDAIVFPATGYLYLAWTIFADNQGLEINSLPIDFRSVNFRRLTVIDERAPVYFQFSILHGSGQFEIREMGEVVVDGCLRKWDDISEDTFSCPAVHQSVEPLTLSSTELYKEVGLRGYRFSGAFRSILKTEIEGVK